ncbi:hypothetical protein R1sor_005818 [Riccia sorocarpa]|uniref:Carbonic anhydrase n=1 Tax=Riccia sorocarpa TaxID=122646 RepID=A0ABD3HNL3_9MARC
MNNPLEFFLAALCLLASTGFGSGADSAAFSYYGSPAAGPPPDKWGDNPLWRTCAVGREQSPIDVNTETATLVINDVFGLDTSYFPANGSLFINSANILEVKLNGAGRLKIQEKTYFLEQFHFHAPSEHTIDGVRFPLEMHLVHKSETGELAVIGIPFAYGEENEFLATFWDKLPLLTGSNPSNNLTYVDVREPYVHLRPAYARYKGSLTTPPCTEGVTWSVILGEANTVSKKQVETYTKRLPYPNARPTQLLNDREVKRNVFHGTRRKPDV